jgi:DNA-binding transcriptional LysR family regulator
MNINSLDLNLLVAFEALVEERNVTRAARRVGLSQPAMSNALARLRRAFEDPILIRARNAMTPTALAQSLIGPVRASLSQLRSALEQKPAFNPAASSRSFHVLANDYAEIVLLAPLTRSIRTLAGDVTLRVHRPQNVFQPPPASAMLDSFDLAIGFYPDALTLESGLLSEVLWEENNVCIAGADHPAIQAKLSLKQYANARHVAVFYKPQGQGVIDSLLSQKGLERKPVLYVPHFNTVPFLVAATDLIATVPERLAMKFQKLLKLQVFATPMAMPPFRLTLLWHERYHADPAHAWMRSQINETALRVAG